MASLSTRVGVALVAATAAYLAITSAAAPHPAVGGALVHGDASVMAPKGIRGRSTVQPVQDTLRWGADRDVADRICTRNRRYAEHSGYWRQTNFLDERRGKQTVFRDAVTGLPIFVAPKGRTWHAFEAESAAHGWPSFRDEEVVWENVRVLPDGETVSVAGTHLGHNIPDARGNRYCINLVCAAGRSLGGAGEEE